MAKSDLIEELKKLGIELTGEESVAELKELIEENTPDEEDNTESVAVNVVDSNGVIRTYSEKEHGKNFLDLANEFAGKVEGRKVVKVV